MKYSRLKRTISGMLAGFMLLSCTSGAVVSFAAGEYNIKFVTDGDTATTTVIEGGVVNAQAVLPPKHTFVKEKPFEVKIGEKIAQDGLVTIAANSGTYYTITAQDHSASGAIPPGVSTVANPDRLDERTYSLVPQLMATLTDGSGTVDIPARGNTNPPTLPDNSAPAVFYTMTVKGTTELPITVDSGFTFKAAADETEGGSISFSTVTDAKGYLLGLNGEHVALQDKITTAGGKKIIKIRVGTYDFELAISMSSDVSIIKDTTFVVSYRLQAINPLILNVITPRQAVDQTTQSIQSNPVDPLAPDKYKIPYIKLVTGDTLSSITTDFIVLAQVERYNAKPPNLLHINWRWEADEDAKLPEGEPPQFANVVAFNADGRQTRSVTLNPRLEDVKGKLYASVDYLLKKPYHGKTSVISDETAIAITVLGTGTPPQVNALTQTVGQTPATLITRVPTYMDVYKGNVAGFTPPTFPHTFTAKMIFGTGRGRAEKTVIRATGVTPDAIKVYIDNSPIPYDFGTDIINTDLMAGQKALNFVAVKQGSVKLWFDYYVKNNTGQLVKADSSEAFEITIKDTTPRDFAQLETLALQSPELNVTPPIAGHPGGAILYGFKSDTYLYANVELPNKAASLSIIPTIPDNKGTEPIMKYEISGGGALGGILPNGNVDSGKPIGGTLDGSGDPVGGLIPMYVENPRTVTLTLKAENGREQIYILTINRMPPSRDSSLKNLTVTDSKGGAILKGFSPTQTEYAATVPYGTRWAKFVMEPNSTWATLTCLPPLVKNEKDDPFGEESWMRLKHKGDFSGVGGEFTGLSNTSEMKIKVQAEDGTSHPDGSKMYSTEYSVKITRADPSNNTLASQLDIKDQKDRPVTFDNDVKFDKNTKKYTAHIPYSSEKLTLSILPDDLLAQGVEVNFPGAVGAEKLEQEYTGDGVPLEFTVPTPVSGGTTEAFIISFAVKAESGSITNPLYIINVVRNDPDQDNSLTGLEVNDQNDAPIKAFNFNPQTTVYTFNVPFDTEQIRVKPIPRSLLAIAKVNGETIDERMPYHITLIKPGETKNIKVEIFPEDKTALPRVYELTVTRELPSSDARLKELTVNGGEDFSPRFVPATTIYQVSIPEGTKSVTFTPTPIGAGSTITINGMSATPGQPSDPYEPYEAKTVVKIEVTAQDGVTKMIYTINVTNQNLLPKSSNADLEKLDIREGSMSPRFKPGVTEYEVAVKDDISSVDILPITRNEEATLKVFSDTKELGDYYDRYSTYVRDGENLITVEVTAEDGKTKKEYQVTVYRKDEEKQGSYKPVTADMVDFTTNPIVVDISRYTVVAAEVFNTLKEKHPDKTMVFEGNDYSLQLTGKDMETLIPHAATYDLGLTFNSPNEEAIWEYIYSYPRNDGIEPVLIHFNHHGVLPGKMLFTISLGRSYRTQNATWNYYNEERDRIDYYGGVRTNSRGTFTVPITHMSTYIYCEDRIDGAENKSGELGSIGDMTGSSGISKPNPNTGVGGQK